MRLVQNSFVGGEIAPELFGRHDIDAYFHAAKNITNFAVRATGGLRKRQGTQLMWHVSALEGAEYKLIPYFYDRTHSACILLYSLPNFANAFYCFCKEGQSPTAATAVNIIPVSSATPLSDIHAKQIGDTIFLTGLGRKTVKGMVYYDYGAVEWSELESDIAVPAAPALTATPRGFNTDESKGFVPSKRDYALIGIKNGVYSTPREISATIYLYWVGGATVTLAFTPNWSQHEQYLVCVKQAGSWAALDSVFPNTASASRNDITWSNTGFTTSATIGGTTYAAGTGSPSTAFKNDPNLLNGEWNSTAAVIPSGTVVQFNYKQANSTAVNIQLWLGALMRQASDNTIVETVSTSGRTKVELMNSANTVIAEWNINAIYSQGPQTLTVDTPVRNTSATYKLRFTTEAEDPDAPDVLPPVILRGAVLGVPQTTYQFVDTNITGGDIVGVMEPVDVGDAGMDCSVADVWEQRLVFAASRNNPFSLWFSRTGDITNFYTNRPQTSESAFSVTIPCLSSSRILHTVTNRWFVLFTESGEYSVDSAGNAGFAYNSIQIKKTSNVGAHENIEPVVTESTILFCAADGRTIYELAYSLEQDNILPVNRTILAHHITEGSQIVRIVFARFPEPQLLCLLEDGTIAAMTYVPAEKVYAWTRYRFGNTDLKCVDIASPGSIREGSGYEQSSEVWLAFRNDSKPGDIWIERMRVHGVGDVQPEGIAKCRDHCGYTSDDFPAGEDPECDVEASVTTVRPEVQDFNSMALQKNIFDCCLRLNRSGAVRIRPEYPLDNATSEYQPDALPVVDASAQTVSLVTKDVKILPRAYNNGDGRMVISSGDRWPLEILSVLFNIEVGEEGGGE